MSLLFGTPLYESYCGNENILESLEVPERAMRAVGEATEASFAEIIAENIMNTASLMSSLYVADAMVECQVFDNVITQESAVEILEEGVKNVVGNIVNGLKKAWEAISAWFKKIFNNIANFLDHNKKFVEKHKDEIKKKVNSMPKDKVAYKGYKYDYSMIEGGTSLTMDNALKKQLFEIASMANVDFEDWKKASSDMKSGDAWKDSLSALKGTGDGSQQEKTELWGEKGVISAKTNTNYKSISEVKEDIKKEVHGGSTETVEVKYGDLDGGMIDDMIAAVTGKRDIKKRLNENYKNLKEAYDNAIKGMKAAQKAINKERAEGEKKDAGIAAVVSVHCKTINDVFRELSNIKQTRISLLCEYTKVSAKVLKAIAGYKDKSDKKDGGDSKADNASADAGAEGTNESFSDGAALIRSAMRFI